MSEPDRLKPASAGDASKEEIQRALLDVLEDQDEKSKAREGATVPRERRSGPFLKVAVLVLSILSAYLWISPPGWLAGPVTTPQPEALQEAGLRMEVYLQALRVLDFRAAQGRLPNSLEEAGDPYSSVTYRRLDAEHFSLSAEGPDGPLVYSSGDPLDAFLGDAVARIREGG